MKIYIAGLAAILCFQNISAQTKAKIVAPQVPCNGTADNVPGIYTDHTNPKYGKNSIKGSAQELSAMNKQLIAIEKLEEQSRKNFELTGCVARVSFSGGTKNTYGKVFCNGYGYQLSFYEYVCHVTEHLPKIVDEYRSVLRVDINPYIMTGTAKAGGTGEFHLKYGNPSYEIPIEAKVGPNFENDSKNNPSRVSQYISENDMRTSRTNDYKNKHADFLKIINGDGYVENWMSGDKYDKRGPNSYQWIDRHYIITKPGIPLLIAVSRKQYLEDMLEYLEIEKANFEYDNAKRLKGYANGGDKDYAVKARAALEADKLAYPKFYESRKTKAKDLLANQKPEWLQQPAIVDNNNKTYDAKDRLESMGKFYDAEGEYQSALYILNPNYFKAGSTPSTKPQFIEVQFRYERGLDHGFSERLISNFEKNFDMEALKKMIE